MGRSAVIAGAGIGGLAAALELRRAGFDVVVVERRRELGEVDTGFLLWSFAIRRLRELGLGEGVEQIGEPLERLVTRNWRGRLLSDVSLAGHNRRLGSPSYDVHRAGLQRLLAEAVGDEHIRLGTPCRGISGDDVVVLEGGETAAADLVVGADGVNSVVRRRVAGDTPLRYPGLAVWRGIAPVSTGEIPRGRHLRYMGPGAIFGAGRLDDETVRWYAGAALPAARPQRAEERRRSALERFGGWSALVPSILERTPAQRYLLSDAAHARPVRRWRAGRVVLLGDAAHPTLPTLATGGGMAIEDAAVLGAALRQGGDLGVALEAYERDRRSAAARFHRAAVLFGAVTAIRRGRLVAARDRALAGSSRGQAAVEGWLMRGGRLF